MGLVKATFRTRKKSKSNKPKSDKSSILMQT